MPEIKTAHELASLLGSTLTSVNPIEALLAQGYTLSGELRQKLESMETAPKLSEEERQRWAERAKAFGPVGFTVGETSPFSLASLAPGEYDLILGFGMDLLNGVLKGLYETRVIPHGLPTDTDSELAIDVLRAWFDGIPEEDDVEIGTFHLTAAPTMSPVDGTERVSLHQPFELDLVRPYEQPPVHWATDTFFHHTLYNEQNVASLIGTVHMTMGVDVQVGEVDQEPQLVVRLIPVDPLDNPPDEERFRIEVDADSTIQPKAQLVLGAMGRLIALFLKRELESREVWNVSPVIPLTEFTGGGPLVVDTVDVRTVTSPLSGAVMIAVRFGWPGSAPGDPQRLTNPFSDQSANFYARARVERVRKIVQEMQESGKLTELAEEEHEDARIDAADVEFGENEIRIKLEGRIVDGCGLWNDLDFWAVHTIHFEFLGDLIRITQSTEQGMDTDESILCVITSLLQAVVVGVTVGAATGALKSIPFVKIAIDELTGEGGPEDAWLYSLQDPIPGTELLPRIHGVSMCANPESLEQFNLISLVPKE